MTELLSLIFTFFTLKPVYDYENLEPDRPTMEIHKPQHPAQGKIERYLCEYGSALCGSGYSSELVRISRQHGADPVFIAALSVLESSAGKHACGYNLYGYASCGVRFTSHAEAMGVVSRTLAGYKKRGIHTVRDMASVWRTGRISDPTDYPERLQKVYESIERG